MADARCRLKRRLAECQREIDDIAFRLYGIKSEDRKMIEVGVSEPVADSLDDIEAGRTEPFFESQDRIRRERNLPPRK